MYARAGKGNLMTKEEFRATLMALFSRAKKQGRSQIEVNAGELHRLVGGFPAKEGEKHNMATCCRVMRTEFDIGGAAIFFEPEKGAGQGLTIRYDLPRPGKGKGLKSKKRNKKDGEEAA